MGEYKVYAHITPNGKIYIGITKSNKPKNRWGADGTGYKGQKLFWRAIQKYGWNNIQHIILLDNLSKELACECEKYLIAKYKTNNTKFGYNLTSGGEGTVGYKFSEEHCKKQSERMIGHTVSNETRKKIGAANSIALKGRILSEETKQKISIALSGENHPMYGKKQPIEAVEKMRQKQIGNTYHLGHKVSEESRYRMSESHKGNKISEETKQKITKKRLAAMADPEKEAARREKIRQTRLKKGIGKGVSWSDKAREAHRVANERRKAAKENNTTV